MSRRALAFILKVITNALLILFSFTCLMPIIWTMYSSMKTHSEFIMNVMGLPAEWHFGNYIEAFERANMGTQFINSIFNSVISVIIVAILAFIIGYFLSRYRFKGRNTVYLLFAMGMLVPIHGFLVPVFLQFKSLGLQNTRLSLLLPYVAFNLPIGIFLVESFMVNIPLGVEEAATIDGASISRKLFFIVMPMAMPIIATILILTFLNVWNEFPFALVLIDSDALKTIPLGLSNFKSQYTVDYPLLMAALTMASLPVILFYLFFSKNVMEGMTSGAMKG